MGMDIIAAIFRYIKDDERESKWNNDHDALNNNGDSSNKNVIISIMTVRSTFEIKEIIKMEMIR